MKTLTLQVPIILDEREAKRFLQLSYMKKALCRSGKQLNLRAIPYVIHGTFRNYEVSVFSYSEYRLEKDILNAQNYHL